MGQGQGAGAAAGVGACVGRGRGQKQVQGRTGAGWQTANFVSPIIIYYVLQSLKLGTPNLDIVNHQGAPLCSVFSCLCATPNPVPQATSSPLCTGRRPWERLAAQGPGLVTGGAQTQHSKYINYPDMTETNRLSSYIFKQ